jgi:MoxR-like ATPase
MRPAQLLTILEGEFLSASEGQHTPVMLWGPPGVGKSQMVAQVAARHGAPVIDLRLSQLEPTDLRGIPFRLGNRVEWAIPAMLPDEERHGPAGVLFLDEINAAPPTVSAAAYQLILDRRLGEYQVPAGWAIFAAGNRQGDRGVTYSMPAPLANRFSHFEVEVHLDDWVAWAHSQGIDERIVGFLRFRPERLFEFDPAHNPTAFPSPRSWEFAHRALQKFGERPGLVTPTLQACVGQAAAAELAAFIRNLDKLPDIDAVLRGEDVSIPREIDLQYAVASALVSRVRRLGDADTARQAYGHILDFATRFPLREMGVMLVADLYRNVGSMLFTVPQFNQWARSVGDLVLYE